MSPVTLQSLVSAAAALPSTPALVPGTVIQAVVAQLLDELTTRLQLPGGTTLDVKADQPLQPGTRVQISIEGPVAQPKILLTPLPPQSSPQTTPTASLLTASLPPSTPTSSIPTNAQASPNPALPNAAASPANAASVPANGVENANSLSAKPLPAAVQSVLPDIVAAPKQVLQAAVTAMVRDAVAKQTGLAPLMADVEAALARPDMPQPVRAAADELLSLRLSTSTPVTAPDIKAAVISSGIAGDPATLQSAQPTAGGDLKAALQNLKDTLTNWIVREEGAADPKAVTPRPAVPTAAPLPNPQRAALPPPHRQAPTMPQPPLPASLPDEASARETAQHLLNKTEGALARQTLLQIASLPDDPAASRPEQSGPRLTLDIPLLTPQGTGVAQLRIEQDRSRREGPDIHPLWRANFSIDIEPIGPVHASIAMFGERAAVTLYAERDDSAERLREGLPLLEAGLNDAALEAGELLCRSGAPSAPRSAPGLFVDQAS
jgi:hypothetical protein